MKFRIRQGPYKDLCVTLNLYKSTQIYSQTMGVNPRGYAKNITLFEFVDLQDIEHIKYDFQGITYSRQHYASVLNVFADPTRYSRFIEECRKYTKRFDGGCT